MKVSIPEKNTGYMLSRGFLDRKSGVLFRDKKKLATILTTVQDGQKRGHSVSDIVTKIEDQLRKTARSAKQKTQIDFVSKLFNQCISQFH